MGFQHLFKVSEKK